MIKLPTEGNHNVVKSLDLIKTYKKVKLSLKLYCMNRDSNDLFLTFEY